MPYKSGHIFEVRNRNTGDTDLTDEHRYFSALQKNMDSAVITILRSWLSD